ncbi:serine hydrolase [Dietzia kunjamensis]|uniref:serine hydrolase n=1 Tax=Dietzia kunjamensis TaxID=322509 RepID=UPI002DBE1BEF|nr:serine hydrolase [Dietzia kunjamensis]MEB8327671.1 serine hydrolase [Dietzia kunjamensis]
MRYRVASALVVVVLALVVAPLTAQASPRSQTLDEQIEHIAHEVVGRSATGMTVAVVDGSQTEILQAFGHADEKQERRLSVDSRMPVASVSKVVTALTALTLHQQGALDLDAPIEQVSHVAMRDERAPADRAPLSGRHLLTHHAGLAESTVLPPPAGSEDLQRPLSDWLQRHPPVVGYPAVGMHYSPLVAYAVLGAAIENASGTSFDDAARRTVLGPVGASSATFRDEHDPADAAIVTPTENGFQAAPWPDAAEAPAASLRWSARDAAALLSALTTKKGGLPEQVVEQARTVSVRPHHGGGGHTQVFFENTRRGVKVLEHAGANGLAWLTLIPEADVGVFVAVNSHDEAATEATEVVVEAVIDWTLESERAHPAPEHPWPAIIPPWLPQSRPAIPTGAFQERLFSRIDRPAPLAELPPGPTVVAGTAWAQRRGIDRVEVRVDDGPWQQAQLADEYSIDTWRMWSYTWDAEPGLHTLHVRATDSDGRLQEEERRPPIPGGATGWHNRSFRVATQ